MPRPWDGHTGRLIAVLRGHTDWVTGLAFSPDGTRLGTSCGDNSIRLRDLATGQEVAELRGHQSYVKAVVFSSDGTQLFSASGDFAVRFWDTLSAAARAEHERKLKGDLQQRSRSNFPVCSGRPAYRLQLVNAPGLPGGSLRFTLHTRGS